MASHQLPPDLGGFNPMDWIGAFGGAVISMVYSRPKTRGEALTRVLVSIAIGGVFGFLIPSTFGWPETAKHALAGGFAMAFFSFPFIGAAYRAIKKIDKLPPGK